MVDLKPAEQAAFGEEAMARVERLCLCPGCPAYPEEDKGEKKTYCMRGDSPHKESIDPKDCLCEMCEVYKHGKLYGSNFFCLEGAALAKGVRNVLMAKPVTQLPEEREARAPALFVSTGLDTRRPDDG